MPAGCPRTVSPPPAECVKLGKDFVHWATEKTDEIRCQVAMWYSLKQKMTRKAWKTLKQSKEFLPYYEQGRAALAKKAVDGTIKEGFGHRYLRYYDQDLKEEEDQDAKDKLEMEKEKIDYAAKVKKNLLQQCSQDLSNLKKELLKDITTDD